MGVALRDVMRGILLLCYHQLHAEMPNRCVAYGCNNTCLEEGISVFHFPKNVDIRKKWIQQVKRTRDGWKGPTGSSVVCSKHFSKDCFAERNLTSGSELVMQTKERCCSYYF